MYESSKLQILTKIHDVVYNKPYDIMPLAWILAIFRKDIRPQRTDRFWCSAFIGFILTKIGLLKADTDWSLMRPCDFALDGENLEYTSDNKLEPCEFILIK